MAKLMPTHVVTCPEKLAWRLLGTGPRSVASHLVGACPAPPSPLVRPPEAWGRGMCILSLIPASGDCGSVL